MLMFNIIPKLQRYIVITQSKFQLSCCKSGTFTCIYRVLLQYSTSVEYPVLFGYLAKAEGSSSVTRLFVCPPLPFHHPDNHGYGQL